jgi:hypothetical protein
VEDKNSIRGGGSSFITSYGFKGLWKVASASAHVPFGGNSIHRLKEIKPPVTHMVREHVQTMTQLRPAVYCAARIPRSARGPVGIYILTTESVQRG